MSERIISKKGIQNKKEEGHRNNCDCAFCKLSKYNEFENNNINKFLSRTESWPRKSIQLLEEKDFKPGRYEKNKGNVLRVETEKNHEGYAWIGAAEHNIDNGSKGVDSYNYMLIESRSLTIYFKPDNK